MLNIADLKTFSNKSHVCEFSGTISIDCFFPMYEPYFTVSMHVLFLLLLMNLEIFKNVI